MKMFVFVFALLGALLASANHNDPAYWRMVRKGVEARILLAVRDDLQNPVVGAVVRVAFSNTTGEVSVVGMTDVHGMVTIREKTDGNSIEISAKKDGYYDSCVKFSLIKMGKEHDIKKGFWMPSPLEKKLELRKKRSPIQPFSQGGLFRIPMTNDWCSFDLQSKDWVRPYGKGQTPDVAFKYTWQGEKPMEWRRQTLGVRFLGNARNGGFLSSTVEESSFPYLYQSSLQMPYSREFEDVLTPLERKAGMLDGSRDFVFRIHSVTNAAGEIISCHYGRFRLLDYGLERDGLGALMLRYDYNLKSCDLNLEFKVR